VHIPVPARAHQGRTAVLSCLQPSVSWHEHKDTYRVDLLRFSTLCLGLGLCCVLGLGFSFLSISFSLLQFQSVFMFHLSFRFYFRVSFDFKTLAPGWETYRGYLPMSDRLVRFGWLLLMSFLLLELRLLVLRRSDLFASTLILPFEGKNRIPCAHIRACTSYII